MHEAYFTVCVFLFVIVCVSYVSVLSSSMGVLWVALCSRNEFSVAAWPMKAVFGLCFELMIESYFAQM